MLYKKTGENIYIYKAFYIRCPYCNHYIDMWGIDIWHNADYMCDFCLKYFTIKLGIEVLKCEK